MIAAGIETAHIKIPVIVRHDQHVRFDQPPLSLTKTTQQKFILRKIRRAGIGCRSREERELFMQTDQTIRVLRLVQDAQPLKVAVPGTQPITSLGERHVEAGIF